MTDDPGRATSLASVRAGQVDVGRGTSGPPGVRARVGVRHDRARAFGWAPLTARDEHANSLTTLVHLAQPRQDTPDRLDVPPGCEFPRHLGSTATGDGVTRCPSRSNA